MSAKSAGTSHKIFALLLGLTATLLIVTVHVLGWAHKAELQALDFRFRKLSTATANEKIVHVCIDDRSLDELGRWPWPRAQLAGLIDILQQAGAKTIALDVILPEPQKIRYVSEDMEVYSAATGKTVGNISLRPIFDDKILREAIHKFGRVFLPMHVELSTQQTAPLELLVQVLLEQNLHLTVGELTDLVAADGGIDRYTFVRAKKRAIEARVEQVFGKNPGLDFQSVIRSALGDLADDPRGEHFDIARRTYLRLRGMRAIDRFAMPASPAETYPISSGKIVPPLVTLGAAGYQTGFATVIPDTDGTVRRIPMLVRSEDHMFPQFALALAADELARKHGNDFAISADSSTVSIRCGDGFSRKIPIDEQGYMLINWARLSVRQSETGNISAANVGAIWSLTQSLQRNRNLRHLLNLHLVGIGREFRTPQVKDLYWKIIELDTQVNTLHQQRASVQRDREQALLFAPNRVQPMPKELLEAEETIEAQIDSLCGQLLQELRDPEHLDIYLGKPLKTSKIPATNPADRAEEKRKYDEALITFQKEKTEAMEMLNKLDSIAAKNAAIQSSIDAQLQELRRLVGDKLCIMGSTATGAADFVPTPIAKRMPGIVVHSNILNTILSGVFVRKAGLTLDIAVIVLAGVIVTLLTATRTILIASPLTIALGLAYAGFNTLVVFHRMNVWLVFWNPLAAMALAFAVVTAYRQLTEERAKRRIRSMFAHALSPVLVDQLLEDPSMLEPSRRKLTFLFSDLQGFTPLAERLGEEKTVKLLHTYFDRMTEVVQIRCGGFLSKFMGDGLFVLFGAPVPQSDHAARAIRAAVDCQSEIRQLNRELSGQFGGDVQLTARIGIASGEVMVGDCGSSRRMDYTAIGDSVNLASRLESANKFFGSRILVSGEAWREANNDSLLARPLGKIVVVGKVEPVEVWELRGESQEASEDLKHAYAEFAEAIEHFAQRRFHKAVQLLEQVASLIPNDRAVEVFAGLSRNYLSNPPADEWDGAMRLTEK